MSISLNGIGDLVAGAATESLPVEGIVADITDFVPDGLFDVVVIDRTLHMLDRDARNRVFSRVLDHVAGEGWILIADERANVPDFERLLSEHPATWTIGLRRGGHLHARRA